jgi:chromosomal replication initiator protein
MNDSTAAATWQTTLGQLELRVTRANFDTWLRDTVGLRHDHDGFVVGAPNELAREWLGVRMNVLITETLASVLGHRTDVVYEVLRLHDDGAPLLQAPDEPTQRESRRHSSVPPALNPCLTFDEFVVGEENRVAYEAAWRVAHEPVTVNPLVIFGPSGLGKTHLLNAIGHAAYERGLSVILSPAERFGNDFVKARNGAFEAFRNRYRHVDVLLIDDVQFFEGKDGFQKEFFHTFNDVFGHGKQIVITADRAPGGLAGIIEGLRSRLQCGLTADVQRPAYETRLAILRMKAKRHRVQLSDAALQEIARRNCPSVRELEGYLNRVVAYAPLVGGEVTRELIDKALSPLSPAAIGADGEPPCADAIIAAVCRRTGAQAVDLRGRSRTRDTTYARHLAMYALKEEGRRSVAEIGRLFGGRDHSTVLQAVARIAAELTTRAETSADMAAVRAALAAVAADDGGSVGVVAAVR